MRSAGPSEPDIAPDPGPWTRERIRKLVADEAAELENARACGVNLHQYVLDQLDRFQAAIADEPEDRQIQLIQMRTQEIQASTEAAKEQAEHDRIYGLNARNILLGLFWAAVLIAVLHWGFGI